MAEGMPRHKYSVSSSTLRENRPTLLERGEVMARNGRLQEAFRLFAEAFGQGNVEKRQLKTLATALVKFQMNKLKHEMFQKNSIYKESGVRKADDLLNCSLCDSLFTEPITLPCGHTFCKFCLEDEFSGEVCAICGSSDKEETKVPTFLLCNIIIKCFPKKHELGLRKSEGRTLMIQGKYDQAIEVFSLVLREEPTDVNCLSWRADCYSCLGMLELALKDIELACKLFPSSVRVLYRKTRILSEKGGREEIVLILLQCAALEPHNSKLRSELESSIYELFRLDFSDIKGSVSQMSFFSGERKAMCLLSNDRDLEQVQPEEDVVMSDCAIDYSNENENVFASDQDKIELKFNTEKKRELSTSSCVEEYKSKKFRQTLVPSTCNVTYDCEQDSQVLRSSSVLDDFECKLCCSLLYKPVTSPCGHNFCRECLRRSLDYRVDCPCCRRSLDKYLAERRANVTVVLDNIIKELFPKEYDIGDKNYEQEMSALKRCSEDSEFEIPIFICTLAFPFVPCPLHIFEPQYKLMVRRCIESGLRQFGMCAPSEDPTQPFPTTGTILKIKEVAYLPDGRSLVNTTGTRRFQVISHHMKDGYNTAKVKCLVDDVEDEVEEIRKLHLNSFEMLESWFGHLTSEQQDCIVSAIGNMPKQEQLDCSKNDQPAWLWWALGALPLQDKPKLIILAMTSVVERLRSITRFLMVMIKMQQRSVAKQ